MNTLNSNTAKKFKYENSTKSLQYIFIKKIKARNKNKLGKTIKQTNNNSSNNTMFAKSKTNKQKKETNKQTNKNKSN